MVVIESSAAMHGCTSSVRAMGGAGTAQSDEALAQRVQTIASRIPDVTFHKMEKMGGSEDFTEMMKRVQEKGGLATNIGIGADFYWTHYRDLDRERVLPAHTGIYDIDESALAFAARLLSMIVFDLMKYPKVV
jgi:aminobenzoyl-glutamate utilization protein A